ncbi:hypothetical protein HanXRQr2_Chr15g0716781 [Helianthus annuus]|uniref:Uncharacterized protein n=1 Tax=Helianthus annuus TaxID=4232 RepID=A0A9K3E3Z4_HELAN|nr:hypothetical protein HanXRQr2_Chr15g0716781 [Helianthus annuus]KAJ0833220.1 hypothetical protein HanPSC8_Chr15g0687771 [Helianthus annuus]
MSSLLRPLELFVYTFNLHYFIKINKAISVAYFRETFKYGSYNCIWNKKSN